MFYFVSDEFVISSFPAGDESEQALGEGEEEKTEDGQEGDQEQEGEKQPEEGETWGWLQLGLENSRV
jgi:hypothetical protein